MLEAEPVASGDAYACMNGVAANRRAAPAAGDRKVFHLHRITDLRDAFARASPSCNTSDDGSSVEFCKQRLALGEQVALFRVRVRVQAGEMASNHPDAA